MNELITLIGITQSVNAIGDTVESETRREVYASVRSVSSKRKLEALALGLRYQWKFVLADYYEYQDEPYVEYDGKRYSVMETYRNADNGIELTAARC